MRRKKICKKCNSSAVIAQILICNMKKSIITHHNDVMTRMDKNLALISHIIQLCAKPSHVLSVYRINCKGRYHCRLFVENALCWNLYVCVYGMKRMISMDTVPHSFPNLIFTSRTSVTFYLRKLIFFILTNYYMNTRHTLYMTHILHVYNKNKQKTVLCFVSTWRICCADS